MAEGSWELYLRGYAKGYRAGYEDGHREPVSGLEVPPLSALMLAAEELAKTEGEIGEPLPFEELRDE